MKQTHTTTILDENENEIELELELEIAPAEYDVGIMRPYIEDWQIVSVNGDISIAKINQTYNLIDREYGEEKFIDKLHNEDAAEIEDYYE